MTSPLYRWGSNQTPPELVWSAELDDRYIIEVRRSSETSHAGRLLIFDHKESDKVILNEETQIYFGAIFGPDVMNVAEWQERAVAVVDAVGKT